MEPVSLAAFAFSLTELAKKFGLKGEWLTVVSVVFGAVGFYLQTYQPEWWLFVSNALIGVTPAAGVSFVQGVVQKMNTRPTE